MESRAVAPSGPKTAKSLSAREQDGSANVGTFNRYHVIFSLPHRTQGQGLSCLRGQREVLDCQEEQMLAPPRPVEALLRTVLSVGP